jgi:uncharacterized protein YjbJ (UPF0337 family)
MGLRLEAHPAFLKSMIRYDADHSAGDRDLGPSKEGGHKMTVVNKQQAEGKFDKAKGEVKEVAGKAIGDEQLEAEGAFDKVKGNIKEGVGNVKEAVREATDGD